MIAQSPLSLHWQPIQRSQQNLKEKRKLRLSWTSYGKTVTGQDMVNQTATSKKEAKTEMVVDGRGSKCNIFTEKGQGAKMGLGVPWHLSPLQGSDILTLLRMKRSRMGWHWGHRLWCGKLLQGVFNGSLLHILEHGCYPEAPINCIPPQILPIWPGNVVSCLSFCYPRSLWQSTLLSHLSSLVREGVWTTTFNGIK